MNADQVFEMMLYEGIISSSPRDCIFDFTSAVLDRDIKYALELLEQSRSVGEASLTLLSVLYNNAKTLLQVQSSRDYKKLGINGFAVKNVLPYRDRYSNGELVRMMRKIRESEVGIKTGTVTDDTAVERVLVEVM